jgi:hypothetical protein
MSTPRENEWEYDVPERVSRAVDAVATRDGVPILLHLRWQVRALMREVKMVHLTEAELVSMVAVLAPAVGRPVISEWDYGVRERVADAAASTGSYGLAGVAHLRWQLRELMGTVKLVNLSVPELAALLAVLSPAHGRLLLADTFEEALVPILRLVHDSVDCGDAAPELAEQVADLDDKLAIADL